MVAYKAGVPNLFRGSVENVRWFLKKLRITAITISDWLDEAEDVGFETLWAKNLLEREGIRNIKGLVIELDEYDERLVRLSNDYNFSEKINIQNLIKHLEGMAPADIKNRKAIVKELYNILNVLTAIAGAVFIFGTALFTKWINDKFRYTIEKALGDIKRESGKLSRALESNDIEFAVESLDELSTSLWFLDDIISKRKYNDLHKDIDASRILVSGLREVADVYLDALHSQLDDGKSIGRNSIGIKRNILEPTQELIVHLESFIEAVDEMEEPTRKFKSALKDIRK